MIFQKSFTLLIALLIPVGFDGGLIAYSSETIAEENKGIIPNEIDLLVDEANKAEKAGLYEKAIFYRKKLVLLAEDYWGRDHPSTASLLNIIAILYTKQHLYGDAIPIFEETLKIYENALGPDHLDTNLSRSGLAWTYSRLGIYTKAIPLFQQALRINERALGIDHIDTISTLESLAVIHSGQGEYQKTELLLKRILNIKVKKYGLNHEKTALIMGQLCLNYKDQADYMKAERLCLQSQKILEESLGSKNESTLLSKNNLGLVYLDQGLLDKAESLFNNIISLSEESLKTNPHNAVYAMANLATVYWEKGLFYKAQTLFENTIEIFKKEFGPSNPVIASNLYSLGLIYLAQGLYDKAEDIFSKALIIQKNSIGDQHPDTALTLMSLSLVYGEKDLLDKAEDFNKRALNINQKVLSSNHPNIANNLQNLAVIYSKKNMYSKAENLYLRALAIVEDSLPPDSPSIADITTNLASLYNNKELYEKALPLYRRSINIYRNNPGPNSSKMSFALYNLGSFYAQQRIFQKAVSAYRQSQKIDLTLIQREIPFLPLSKRKSFLESLGHSHTPDEIFSDAIFDKSIAKIALFSRLNWQGLLEEIEKRQTKLSTLSGPKKIPINRLREITQRLASKTINKNQRNILIDQQEKLERKIYSVLPELEPRVVELSDIAKSIPLNSVLIEYQRYQPIDRSNKYDEQNSEAAYLAFILKPNLEIKVVDLGNAISIDKAIKKALIASEKQKQDAKELWDKVSALIIKPLNKSIDDAKTLFISPDAELNRIPFAALSSYDDDLLLGETVNLRLLTTGRELLVLANGSTAITSNPLVVANPTFDFEKESSIKTEIELVISQERSSDLGLRIWQPLPGTAKEGRVVSTIINAQFFSKENATALLLQQHTAPKVVHIASHAFYQQNNQQVANPLLRSGIVLAGANQPDSNPDDDGYLTALEVAKLDWQGTEMVVISGCESGQGDIQSGEGVYGLKRAIAVAGARSSLLSLWKVDDRATAAFMTSFYKKLKDGDGRADALAATQKEFRNHSIPGWRHPYVWAAFQLSGDWRPIDF